MVLTFESIDSMSLIGFKEWREEATLLMKEYNLLCMMYSRVYSSFLNDASLVIKPLIVRFGPIAKANDSLMMFDNLSLSLITYNLSTKIIFMPF